MWSGNDIVKKISKFLFYSHPITFVLQSTLFESDNSDDSYEQLCGNSIIQLNKGPWFSHDLENSS